jgi:hypothetical protein
MLKTLFAGVASRHSIALLRKLKSVVFCETNTTRYAGGSKKAMPMSRKTSPPLIK